MQDNQKEMEKQLRQEKDRAFKLEQELEKAKKLVDKKTELQESFHTQKRESEIQQLNERIRQLEAERQNVESIRQSLQNELDEILAKKNQEFEDSRERLRKEAEDYVEQNKVDIKQEAINSVKQEALDYVEQNKRIHEQEKRLLEQKLVEQGRIIDDLLRENDKSKGIKRSPTIPGSAIEIEERKEELHPMTTRSTGPAQTGQEIIHEVHDPQGQVIETEITYELAGNHYNIKEYVTNLVREARSQIIKNFKDAFVVRQKELGDKSTFNNKRYVEKAFEILEKEYKGDKVKITKVLNEIMQDNQRGLLNDFTARYYNEYKK
jgi:hypothetical protein